jgi:SSS family solute:Na+ symporter
LAGLVWGTDLLGMSMVNLGFHSIFMASFLFAFLTIIFYTNASSTTQDAKAYDYDPEITKTDSGFFVGAMGIVLIIAVLYAYFW